MPNSKGQRPNLCLCHGYTKPWIAESDPWYGKAVGKSWRQAAAVMRIEWQIGFWIGAFLLLVLLLWLFSGVLLPFAAAVALGYLFDPIADRLERLGFNRLSATLLIIACSALVLILISILIVPVLWRQAGKSHRGAAGLCRQAGGTDFGRDRAPLARLRRWFDG